MNKSTLQETRDLELLLKSRVIYVYSNSTSCINQLHQNELLSYQESRFSIKSSVY